MKPDYTLLKRSKVDVNRFAFVYDGDVLSNFTADQLYRTLEKLGKQTTIKDVDVLWRDGTRTVEELRVTEHRHFVRFDTCEYDHAICLMMRAQGLPVELSVPVDVRKLFDEHGPLISEIRVPCEFAADLKPALERFIQIQETIWMKTTKTGQTKKIWLMKTKTRKSLDSARKTCVRN